MHWSLLFFISLSYSESCAQPITLLSWNIQDCGRTKSDDEIYQIALIVKEADIVAVQEVVAGDPAGAQAIGRLGETLSRMGAKWEYRISDPTRSPSPYRSERYAYLWKPSVVKMIGRPKLDSLLYQVCDREPFLIKFKEKRSGKTFMIVNFHSRRYDERPEDEVVYFTEYPNRFKIPVIIAGDFNMSESHDVFNGLYKQGYSAAVKNAKTTLKKACANASYLANAIDNIYLPRSITLREGRVIDFVKNCDRLMSARQISDHLPVICSFSIN